MYFKGHINNLYNTCFWNLVQVDKLKEQEAEKILKGTLSADKNEILFSKYSINYNNIEEIYRKGSFVISKDLMDTNLNTFTTVSINDNTYYCYNGDIIKESFWNNNERMSLILY